MPFYSFVRSLNQQLIALHFPQLSPTNFTISVALHIFNQKIVKIYTIENGEKVKWIKI